MPNRIADDILMHIGTETSGRYPLGSGENPYQHSGDFLSRVNKLSKSGMSEKEIAIAVGFRTTGELRVAKSMASNLRRGMDVAKARAMLSDGYSKSEIAKALGRPESSIRSLLNERSEMRMKKATETAEALKKIVAERGMIDVGAGVERELGISREKMKQALTMLEQEGYPVYGAGVPQVTNPGKQTNIQVLCPPGTPHKDIYQFDKIATITDYRVREDADGNDILERGFVYPKSLDSSRIKIRYAEEGGKERDGTIELRRGVDDISLGESTYSQVRILVDGKSYLKGMALYSDDIPDGADVVFNTSKRLGTPADAVFKPIKDDPDNPFGALIKETGGQSYYYDADGNRQLRVINKTRAENDWNDWNDSLPSQFLSKQPMSLIRKQLDLSVADAQAEFNDICALTNPTVKKKLLDSFADDCDSTAVHLQAAALPRQKYQVILPVPTMKDNEVYAPNYEDGETVALIRYPHGGTFEIPILRVNKRQPEARKMLGATAADAIGINSNVAARLSGADFDGDTVMVIPCNSSSTTVRIQSKQPLKNLEGFDAKMEYPERTGMKYMKYTAKDGRTVDSTQGEMGAISNLITDMTLKGATDDELARAVKHSMVVIDAGKHHLDYTRSAEVNGIAALKKRYQGRVEADGSYHEGASTLISLAKKDTPVLKRKGNPHIDPETGEVTYKEVQEEYVDKKGKTQTRMQKVPLMSTLRDANEISSGTPQESAYADYANRMKALANEARKERMRTGNIVYRQSSKETYRAEVDQLLAQLNVSLLNAPRERQAQLYANSVVRAKKNANPDMTRKEQKKAGQMALSAARARFGAKRTLIKITDRAWEAIQAGAISETVLSRILDNADMDDLRQRATPRNYNALSSAKAAKIASMKNSGYTTSEIAKAIGCSTTTVSNYLANKE